MPVDQTNVTAAIAQGVQNNAGASNASNTVNVQAPGTAPEGGGGFKEFITAFATNFAGGNYVQSQLNQKAQLERESAAAKFKINQEKQAAELKAWTAMVKQGGSKVFNSPEAQKFYHKDPELYDLAKQQAQFTDNTQSMTAQALQALKMNPALAQLQPQEQKLVQNQQSMDLKAKTETDRNVTTIRGQDLTASYHNAEIAARLFGISQADKRAASKSTKDDSANWIDKLNKDQAALLDHYNPTTSKYDDKAARAAAKAHNARVDAITKQLQKKDPDFDASSAYVDLLPGTPGKIYGKGPDRIVARASTDTPAETPTGPGAAGKALANPSIPEGTRQIARDGTHVTRKGGKWVAD